MIEIHFYRPRSPDAFAVRRWFAVPAIGSTVTLGGVRFWVSGVGLGDFVRGDGSPIEGRTCAAVTVLTERERIGARQVDPVATVRDAYEEIIFAVRAYLAAEPEALEVQLAAALRDVGLGIIAGACATTLRGTVRAIETDGLHPMISSLESIEAAGVAHRDRTGADHGHEDG